MWLFVCFKRNPLSFRIKLFTNENNLGRRSCQTRRKFASQLYLIHTADNVNIAASVERQLSLFQISVNRNAIFRENTILKTNKNKEVRSRQSL